MSALEAFRRLSGQLRLAGSLAKAEGGTALPVIDPATEEHIGEIVEASAVEIDAAVAAANAAQKSWHKVNAHRRAELLHEVARRMMTDRPLVAEMLVRLYA